jgi:hypothetical protein
VPAARTTVRAALRLCFTSDVSAAEIKAYRARIPGRKSATPPVEAGFKSQDFAVENAGRVAYYRAKLTSAASIM